MLFVLQKTNASDYIVVCFHFKGRLFSVRKIRQHMWNRPTILQYALKTGHKTVQFGPVTVVLIQAKITVHYIQYAVIKTIQAAQAAKPSKAMTGW